MLSGYEIETECYQGIDIYVLSVLSTQMHVLHPLFPTTTVQSLFVLTIFIVLYLDVFCTAECSVVFYHAWYCTFI